MKRYWLIFFVGFLLLACSNNSEAPVIELNGDSEITLEVFTEYTDLGATAIFNGKEYSVETSDIVDTNTLGTYSLSYDYSIRGLTASTVTRIINIVDTTIPELSIVNQGISINPNEAFPNEAIVYSDNYDDIADIQVVVRGMDELVYGENELYIKVVDTSGNESVELSITVNALDVEAPTIAFSELDDFTQEQNIPYTDDYLIISDNVDSFEDISVVVEGEVNVTTLGEYEISYYAVDKSGNQSETITKTVTVVEQEELSYYERYMKNHTSMYDPVNLENSYMYDALEKAYRGVVLDNHGDYHLVYYFFLHNLLNEKHVLNKIEFVNPDGENIVYELEDQTIDYVFEIPLDFVNRYGRITILTYPHPEYSTSTPYWEASFSFNSTENLDLEYVLSQELKLGNLK